ncbi:hypothetical protein [Ornithinibacillus sp. JPR2-1]|uniref:hypothetical protein n=1 Tax=Ornithinibacillus sp. JPR2-1 TaxID=2094019 RepID=UPI0031D397AD
MQKEIDNLVAVIKIMNNRLERLEKKIDELEEEKRATSKKEFDEYVDYVNSKLNELI